MLLPRHVARLRAAFPNIIITIEEIAPRDVLARVAAGQVDLGIGYFAATPDEIESLPLMQEEAALICRRDHPLAAKSLVRAADLKGVPIVSLADIPDIRVALDAQLRLAGIYAPPAIEVSHLLTSLGMVSEGLGVAIWPAWATRILSAFDTVAIPLLEARGVHEISIVTSKLRSTSPAAQSFIDLMIEQHAEPGQA